MTPQEETLIVAIIIAAIQAYVAWLNTRAHAQIVDLKTQVAELKQEIVSLRLQLTESKLETKVAEAKT